MSRLVPGFPLLEEPGDWDALTLVAATCFLEAEAEPDDGILGVAWVIRRRAIDWKASWHGAILGKDLRAYQDGRPFEAFSCWNDDYATRAKARLSAAPEAATTQCWRSAAGVLWDLLPDPVGGASFYLNVPLTKKIRPDHGLPAWYSEEKVTRLIGRHTFLRG